MTTFQLALKKGVEFLSEDVFNRSDSERLVSGGVWFLTLMVVSGFFWLFWGIILGRSYGPEGFGIFSTALSIYNFAWAFIFGGLFEGLIKHGAENIVTKKWNMNRLFSTSLRYLTGIGIILFLTLFLFSFWVEDLTWKIVVLSIGFSFLFSGAKDALASIIGSYQLSTQLAIINSSMAVTILLIGLAFIGFGVPNYFLPVILIFATVGQLILTIYYLRLHLTKIIPFSIRELLGKKIRATNDFKLFTQILVFGFYISLGITAFNIMKSLDIVALNLFFEHADVGIYSVADAVSSILFYMTSFSLPIIPAVSEANAKGDRSLLVEQVKIAAKYPLIIGVPLTIIIFMLARPIVTGIYGPTFIESVQPLQVLIIGTFMLMLGYNLSSILIGIGRSKLSGLIMVVAAIQYILSLYILVPLYGFIGAALSLTLTGFTPLLLAVYFIKRYLHVTIFDGLLKIFISSAVMGGVLYFIPQQNPFMLILGMFGSVVVFGVILYTTGYLTREDIHMIKTAMSKFKRD